MTKYDILQYINSAPIEFLRHKSDFYLFSWKSNCHIHFKMDIPAMIYHVSQHMQLSQGVRLQKEMMGILDAL